MVKVDEILQFLASITADRWIGLLGILAAFVAAWIFYRRALSPVQLSYDVKTTTLLGGHAPGVSISYKGKRIDNLHKANYIFWNSGKQPITEQNVPTKSPLQIVFPAGPKAEHDESQPVKKGNITFLDVSILHSSRPDNGVHIIQKEMDQEIKVSFPFEYLEPSQGFNVEVLFEGDEATTLPDPSGKIIGMRGDLRKPGLYSRMLSFLVVTLYLVICGAIAVAFVLFTGSGPDFYARYFEGTTLCPALDQLEDRLVLPLAETLGVFMFSMISLFLLISRFRSRRDIPTELNT